MRLLITSLTSLYGFSHGHPASHAAGASRKDATIENPKVTAGASIAVNEAPTVGNPQVLTNPPRRSYPAILALAGGYSKRKQHLSTSSDCHEPWESHRLSPRRKSQLQQHRPPSFDLVRLC